MSEVYLGYVIGADGQIPVCLSKSSQKAKSIAKQHRQKIKARGWYVRSIPVSRTDSDFQVTSIRNADTNKWEVVLVTPITDVDQRVATENWVLQ